MCVRSGAVAGEMYADMNMAFKPGSKKGLFTRQTLETSSLQVTLRTHTAGCLLVSNVTHVRSPTSHENVQESIYMALSTEKGKYSQHTVLLSRQ